MSFLSSLSSFSHKAAEATIPGANKLDLAWNLVKPKAPPTPPGVPNPNDAANAAQTTTDQMRQRRGLLANIYAGAQNQTPVTGKVSLGT
jgi:hypothetical protein